MARDKPAPRPEPRISLREYQSNRRVTFNRRHWRSLREIEDTSQPKLLPEARARLSVSPELAQTAPSIVGYEIPIGINPREQVQCVEDVNIDEESRPTPPIGMRGRDISMNSSPDSTRQTEDTSIRTCSPIPKPEQSKRRNPCMLLNAIPLELREIIFDHVLGTQATLHLISRANRVGHLLCPDRTLNPHTLSCCCSTTIERAEYSYKPYNLDEKDVELSHINLSLLQTCRQAYREGIHILYSRPTFDIPHPETLNWLKRTIPPQRLSTISKLNISLDRAVPYHLHENQKLPFRIRRPQERRSRNPGDLLRYWDPAWRTILCDMHGLKHLTVILRGYYYHEAEYVEPVLKPLLELRGLVTFQFRLAGKCQAGTEAERVENLKAESPTLRTILERATSERTEPRRKAEDLDWNKKEPRRESKRRKMS